MTSPTLSVMATDEEQPLQPGLAELERLIAESVSRVSPGESSVDLIHLQISKLFAQSALTKLKSASPLDSPIRLLEAQSWIGRAGSPIDSALKQNNEAHIRALHSAGVDSTLLSIMKSWLVSQVEGRVLQQHLEIERIITEVVESRSNKSLLALDRSADKLLTAAEIGKELRVSAETVRRRITEKELFFILTPGRKRGRLFPAFQAWPEIAGSPLQQVLRELTSEAGSSVYGFFVAASDLLGGLAPVEVLSGKMVSRRSIDKEGEVLLLAPASQRLQAVVTFAKTYSSEF